MCSAPPPSPLFRRRHTPALLLPAAERAAADWTERTDGRRRACERVAKSRAPLLVAWDRPLPPSPLLLVVAAAEAADEAAGGGGRGGGGAGLVDGKWEEEARRRALHTREKNVQFGSGSFLSSLLFVLL